MKPGRQIWAENSVYASGVDVGLQNKYEPSAARVSDGFERGTTLSAGWENMFRWRMDSRLDYLSQIRLKNWTEKGSTSKPAMAAGVGKSVVADYRPLEGTRFCAWHQIEMTDGATEFFHASAGGEVFTAGPSGLPAGVFMHRMRADELGNAAIAAIVGASGLYYSAPAAPTVWAAWAGTVGLTFSAVDKDRTNGNWIAYESSAGDIYSGGTLGAALTLRQAVGYVGSSSAIEHSNHPAGTLWPQDAGNMVALYGDRGGNWYRSTDSLAATWSALAPAPFAPQLLTEDCLAYSKYGSRFGAIVNNGPGTTRPTFAYSDDNGATWVEVVDSFAWQSRGYAAHSLGNDPAFLVCDGWGHWLAGFGVNDGVSEIYELWVSADNGLTWLKSYQPVSDITTSNDAAWLCGWYGDGAFWVCHTGYVGGVAVTDVISTLRVGE